MATNHIGNALAGIADLRQQRRANALADRQIVLDEQVIGARMQQAQTEAMAARRARFVDAGKGLLTALARAPRAARESAFQQIISTPGMADDLTPEFVQHIISNPDALEDQNIAAGLNYFGTLTPDQEFNDLRRKKEAETVPVAVTVPGQGGKPMQRFISPFSEEGGRGVETSADANSLLSSATSRRGQDISAATAQRGQNMADARAREQAAIQRAGLGRPQEFTDPATGRPVLVQFDAQGKPRRVDGLLPAGAGKSLQDRQQTLASIDQQLATINLALGHPGRTDATGYESALFTLPGSEEADFEAIANQISGAAFLQAFESLKGGGAITEIEGRRATQAIARLDLNQSDAAYEAALKELRTIMSNARKRLAGRGAAQSQPSAPTSNVVDWSDL